MLSLSEIVSFAVDKGRHPSHSGLRFQARTMREKERNAVRKRLDKELRYYRWAGKEKHPTQGLLRAVRKALGIPAIEIARKMDINPSVLFRLEQNERRGRISMDGMMRVAGAMGCQVVYAVIPRDGKTLEYLAERRSWGKELENRDVGNRE